jgi:threonylcarbamoyladenosine tRNA methylthiotransferase MtaB
VLDAAAQCRVAFVTLGCKVNRFESESIAAELLGGGARIVKEDQAHVVVVNTCTVTGEADAKARKAVRRALGGSLSPVVVVTGCLAVLDAPALTALGERVVVEPDKEHLASRVRELLGMSATESAPPARTGVGFRSRAILKVEDGCDAFCSYCIVPHARGGPRSVGRGFVVEEARRLVDAGVREIVLTGINVGRYRDADSGDDLPALLSAVAATGVERLRLSSIEPRDLTPRFLSIAAQTRALCPHLHVPLQSGSDSVLSAMGRDYTTDEYAESVRAARTAIPGLAVTTDVIAGFPGERDRDAAETLAFCEAVRFRKMHIFRYSPRRGTPAALLAGQVGSVEKSGRAVALRKLSGRLWREDVASRFGETRTVLAERVRSVASDELIVEGTTPDYLRVSARVAKGGHWTVQAGDCVRVRLTGVAGERVAAEVLEPVHDA